MTERLPQCWKYPRRACPGDCQYCLPAKACIHDLGPETDIRRVAAHTWRFTCVECKRDLTRLGRRPERPVCGLCLWIDANAQPEARAGLRSILCRQMPSERIVERGAAR